jgi:hypothetical protein
MAGGALSMTGALALALLAACAPDAPAADAASPQAAATKAAAPAAKADFNGFWTRFRAAALAGDAAALRAMSAPTVASRGELDDDAELKLAPAKVPAAVKAVLDKPDGADPQGRTLRQIIRTKTRFQPSEFDGPDQQRVGDLEFQRGRDGWRLATIYRGAD